MLMLGFDLLRGLDIRLDVVSPLVAGKAVRWTFTITNSGDEPCILTFNSTQQGDVVLEAEGAEQYRWSEGKLFAAVISVKELQEGDEWTFELDDVLSVEPGVYSLLATVTAQPAPPSIRRAVSVESAG